MMRSGKARGSRSKVRRMALALGAIALLGVGAFLLTRVFPPGPVSAASPRGEVLGGYHSHAEFEKECSLCHSFLSGVDADRCEKCHGRIAQERQENVGVHGRLPGTEKCDTCHEEHQGREGILNRLPTLPFDHGLLTGFSLVKHRTGYDGLALTCESCHGQGGEFDHTVDCVTCHRGAGAAFVQEHEAQFGSRCSGCHDGRDRMAGFDHDTAFVIDGAHQALSCEDCHPDRSYVESRSDCVACHPEPAVHQGHFGLQCQRCHLTSAWAPAELRVHGFPLDHGGQELDCPTCHIGDNYVDYTCIGCHEHEPRQIRGAHVERGIADLSECAACHPTGRADEAARTRTTPMAPETSQGGSHE